MMVLMFHSVGNTDIEWQKKWLSVSLLHFETLCRFLKYKGYKTLLLDDWYRLTNNPKEQTGKEIFLTFDDGYIDTWVFAYPILKKYGLRGTVFINPEFVDPYKWVRPNIESVEKGELKIDQLQRLGFLSWPEIQQMDTEGVIQAQSHSMSHNHYFCSDRLVDFFVGQPKYSWLTWFLDPERKPFYFTDNHLKIIPYGYPIFENYRALGLRRFIPSTEFVSKLTMLAANLRVQDLKPEGIKDRLRTYANEFLAQNGALGQYETDLDMEKRYRYELFESKKIIEEKVKHPIEFLCWPGGGYNELSVKLSVEAGYIASTIASREDFGRINNNGNYKRIARYGTGSFVTTKMGLKLISNPNYLVQTLLARKGSFYHRVILKLRKEFVKLMN